jgi:hypothetical protein
MSFRGRRRDHTVGELGIRIVEISLLSWCISHDIVKAASHHLPSTSHTTLDPDKRFTISQALLPRIPTFPTSGEAIVADYAAATAGVTTFGHDLRDVID